MHFEPFTKDNVLQVGVWVGWGIGVLMNRRAPNGPDGHQQEMHGHAPPSLPPGVPLGEQLTYRVQCASPSCVYSSVAQRVCSPMGAAWARSGTTSVRQTCYPAPYTARPVQVIQALEGDRKRYDRVVDSAQRFAYTYLSTYNKALYVRQALLSYNALFEDMGELMEQLEVGSSEHRGGTLPLMELLLHMKKFTMSKDPSLSLEIEGVRW